LQHAKLNNYGFQDVHGTDGNEEAVAVDEKHVDWLLELSRVQHHLFMVLLITVRCDLVQTTYVEKANVHRVLVYNCYL